MAGKLTLKLGTKVASSSRSGTTEVEVIKKRRVFSSDTKSSSVEVKKDADSLKRDAINSLPKLDI